MPTMAQTAALLVERWGQEGGKQADVEVAVIVCAYAYFNGVDAVTVAEGFVEDAPRGDDWDKIRADITEHLP